MGKPKGESRGLEFLRDRRPQAIEHLLSFFAESARHLDPKTRFLISIVTKVISGSERGVQQYVKRALENGAGPDEVIDAVLCAYPCAGLTKVVDAIDTILDMGIPGLVLPSAPAADEPPPTANHGNPGNLGGTGNPGASPPSSRETLEWIPAGDVAEIPPICGRRVIAGFRDIVLFRVEDEVLAIDNRCPHKGGSLADGIVIDGIVSCPLHQWRFDLRTGRCPDRPRVSVRTYPVRREGTKLFIGI